MPFSLYHAQMTESAFGAATPSNEVIDKYCDEKGIPIAPKSIKDMLKRVVHTIWDDAINEEDSGLDRMEIFEHDVSRAELRTECLVLSLAKASLGMQACHPNIRGRCNTAPSEIHWFIESGGERRRES